jgi:hypothetical protein
MARKMNPDEWAAQKAEWARQRKEFEATYARLKARWQEEDERRERRRRRLRRLLLRER